MRSMEAKPQARSETLTSEYMERIIRYLKSTAINPAVTIPLDESLLETGVLDSFGIVDLITFVEGEFDLHIPDAEITKANMGSIRKMAHYIALAKTRNP